MKYTLCFCAVGLMLVLAQPAPLQAQAQLPVKIEVDHASFAYSDEHSLVEVYLAVDAGSLDYEREGDLFTSRLPLDVAIVRSATTDLEEASVDPVWTDSVVLCFSVPDTSAVTAGQHFIHQLRSAVPPGEYELRVAVPADDESGRQRLELRRDVAVPDFRRAATATLSDITLASSIATGDERDNPFYKNGLIIRPNANQLYGQGLSQLYYYAEAYRTEDLASSDERYNVYTYIAEANRRQAVGGLERRLERPARSPDVLVGNFDVSALPSGSYFLRMALLNESNEAVVEQSRKFFVYNPTVEREQPAAVEFDFETSEYAGLTEDEVEQGLLHAQLIANETEQRRIRRLPDIDSKRRFLMDFWQKRDDQPATPVNEFKDEFYRRLQYANDRYSSNMQEGWRSDRGRVLIRYGLPTSIEPHLYDRETSPHEIWQYNNIPGAGQAIFVFADVTGFGQFELLHSTVAGERSLPNWQDELRGR